MSEKMTVRRVRTGELVASMEKMVAPQIAFDIETQPGPEALLRAFFADLEIDLPPEPGEFDPSKVKTGNTKNPELIAAKLSEAAAKHATYANGWKDQCDQIRDNAWKEFVESAPLSAKLGEICAIGYGLTKSDGSLDVVLDIANENRNEAELLSTLWSVVVCIRRKYGKLIHLNGHRFDLPFCIRRTWVQRMHPPECRNKYRRWDDWSIDLVDTWSCGVYRDYISLQHAAKLFGVQGKLDGVDGSMFWKLLRDGHLDIAKDYLEHDIIATAGVAKAMGAIDTR